MFGRRSILRGAASGWRSRSLSSAVGHTSCWRLVRITLISVCWTSAPCGVRLPPQFLPLTQVSEQLAVGRVRGAAGQQRVDLLLEAGDPGVNKRR